MGVHGFERHDHARCVGSALDTAERFCAENKLKLTPARRRVLEILLSEHKAMGAYDILAILAAEGVGSQPPVVYRALDFLVGHGFVHKIERLNSYIACAHPGATHSPAFMICRACHHVVETPAQVSSGLDGAAADIGFAIEARVVEAEGLCPNCQSPDAVAR
ncbi:transcriptional repressor [Cognatishimia sp. SS12]|uniref:transcriptional repressor n=1 Tax=Cognatishimia sp. SS12 TaxID=2979465 RepID=UPI00232B6316|nr:transcriptional repressor [Cognatishimia sp. SS12]MDC0737872.1 transcriptional repressor [Cognatishimia sp. SS12]